MKPLPDQLVAQTDDALGIREERFVAEVNSFDPVLLNQVPQCAGNVGGTVKPVGSRKHSPLGTKRTGAVAAARGLQRGGFQRQTRDHPRRPARIELHVQQVPRRQRQGVEVDHSRLAGCSFDCSVRPERQRRNVVRRRPAGEFHHAVLGFADDDAVHVRTRSQRFLGTHGGVPPPGEHQRAGRCFPRYSGKRFEIRRRFRADIEKHELRRRAHQFPAHAFNDR